MLCCSGERYRVTMALLFFVVLFFFFFFLFATTSIMVLVYKIRALFFPFRINSSSRREAK